MRLEPPSWWYAERPSRAARLLSPVAQLVDAAAIRRWASAKPYRSRLPVICVGNLTVGGAGKTPIALALAGLLAETDRRAGFLTRGYGGWRTGPYLVDPAIDGAAEVGDEPLLLARAAPTMVARQRAAGARALAGQPVDVIIMDDGLQNPQLAKQLSIAVLDGMRLIGNGLVMPAGPLRESLDTQLRRVDALVVLTGAGDPVPALPPDVKRFQGQVLHAELTPSADAVQRLARARVVAYAGIGRPSKLFDTLRSLGAQLVVERPLPDHHRYRAREAAELVALANEHRAMLVTTEKDMARLAGVPALADLAAASYALPVTARFSGRDRDRMRALFDLMLARA